MRFIADAMLGRLARWLRFLGYDVLYFRDIEDSHLVRIARAEGRTLITRDRGIPKRFDVQCLLLNSETLKEQLSEVIERFPPPDETQQKRCMECNRLLKEVSKTEVKELVPDYVWFHREEFFLCPGCGRVYWEGSHIRNMRNKLNEMGISFNKR